MSDLKQELCDIRQKLKKTARAHFEKHPEDIPAGLTAGQMPASGVPGITWHAPSGKWQVHIYSGGKGVHLGLRTTIEEALQLREQGKPVA